jgi:DNA phosphorothioation-dependent restriction protein DptG
MDYNLDKYPTTYSIQISYKAMPFDVVQLTAKTEHEALEMARNRLSLWAKLDSEREVVENDKVKVIQRYKVVINQKGGSRTYNAWVDANDELQAIDKVKKSTFHHVAEVTYSKASSMDERLGDLFLSVIKQEV